MLRTQCAARLRRFHGTFGTHWKSDGPRGSHGGPPISKNAFLLYHGSRHVIKIWPSFVFRFFFRFTVARRAVSTTVLPFC